MKKLTVAAIIFALSVTVLLFAGCTQETAEPTAQTKTELDLNEDKYPVYHSFDDEGKRIYGMMYDALKDHRTDAHIGVYASEEELDEAVDWLDDNFRQIIFEQPDFFWVDPYNYTFKTISSLKDHTLVLCMSYLVERNEIDALKSVYDSRIENIVEEAEEQTSLFDKVLYVHDELLSVAEYDEELLGSEETKLAQSAYGCVVEGKTVCSGYALAFTSVMQKLGVECGSEFNTYSDFSIIDGHVWNYCKLDGEYYYFDLTWDDTVFDTEEYKPYLDYSHTYFGITEAELAMSNFTIQKDAPTPDCNGTAYNYFVYTGSNIPVYDIETVRQAILSQADNKYIALRFDSYSELLKAESELMENGGIYEILPEAEEVLYVTSNSKLHLYIFAK